MKIRNFTDAESLKVGDWIENGSGIFEITEPYCEQGYVRYAEVVFDEDEDGTPLETYTLANHGTLTPQELKHFEKV